MEFDISYNSKEITLLSVVFNKKKYLQALLVNKK